MVNNGQAYLCRALEGYNPPDFYPKMSTYAEYLAFRNALIGGGVGGNVLNFALDSEIGTLRLQISPNANMSAREYPHVHISYTNNGTTTKYVGNVINYKFVAENVLEVKYTIDWYTSFLMTVIGGNSATSYSLTCNTVLYRRLTNGEFTYLSENFTPTKVKNVKHDLVFETNDANNTPVTGNAYDLNCRGYYMVYHESRTNTTHKIFMILDDDYVPVYPYSITPGEIWTSYCVVQNVIINADISGHTHDNQYDPDNLIFFGYTNINPYLICAQNTSVLDPATYGWTLYCFSDVRTQNTVGGFLDWIPNSSKDKDYVCENVLLYTNDEVGASTEYSFKRILDANGEIVYDIPFNMNIEDGILTNVVVGGPDNSPYVTFLITDNDWKVNNAISFSFPFNQLTYYSDSFARYLAQDKQYLTEMRNLQNMNEVVSGVIGGVNQGAMISAFSRTQTKGLSGNAINKGLIGGGVAIAGTIAMGAYRELYANKQESDIIDMYNRNKPDTLIMASQYPRMLVDNAGLYSLDYDDDTIEAITTYHSKFGYPTHKIGTNVAINTLVGYVQADLIFSTGLRQEVSKYIKDMFNYGVRFTLIA